MRYTLANAAGKEVVNGETHKYGARGLAERHVVMRQEKLTPPQTAKEERGVEKGQTGKRPHVVDLPESEKKDLETHSLEGNAKSPDAQRDSQQQLERPLWPSPGNASHHRIVSEH